jgi:hypothetical protein
MLSPLNLQLPIRAKKEENVMMPSPELPEDQ